MRLLSRNHRHARAGLTLVEMLIALALSIFIMAIMSEAFVKGLEAFGQFKALSDLEQRLRTFANIIRRDLRAPHFDSSKKLSECTVTGRGMPQLDGLKAGTYTTTEAMALLRQMAPYQFKTPSEGFFSIEEWPNRGNPPLNPARATMFFEGQDVSGRPSYRDLPMFDSAGNILYSSDVLHFTSRLEGNEPDKFFYGKARAGSQVDGGLGVSPGLSRYDSAGNGMYTSQEAELLYFLGADDSQFTPGASTPGGPVLTFNLYRQAWLLVPSRFSDGTSAVADSLYGGNPTQYFADGDVSGFVDMTGKLCYNSMADVQHRARRIGAGSVRAPKRMLVTAGAGLEGSDIMLTNVISFDVKVFDPFAYKIPFDPLNPTLGPLSGRGAYVDIGDVIATGPTGINPRPTAATAPLDALTPVYGSTVNVLPAIPAGGFNLSDTGTFDTGTKRFEGDPFAVVPPFFTPAESPATHRFPFTSIQITIRVWEPKSQQTRQITIIQDM